MKKFILLAAFQIAVLPAIAQLVLKNTRTVNHQALTSIKLSLIPPPGFSPFPGDRGFFQTGTIPENGSPQIVAGKFQVDFSYFRQSLDTVSGATGKTEVDLVLDNTTHYTGVWFRKVHNFDGKLATSLTFGFGNTFFSYLLTGFFDSQNAATETLLTQAMQSAYIDIGGYPLTKAKSARAKVSAVASSRTEHLTLANTSYTLAEAPTDDWSIYTQDGLYPAQLPDKSFLQLKRTTALVSEASRQTYSSQLLSGYTEFNSVTHEQTAAVSIGGLPGIEITADAVSANAGRPPVKIIQVTLFDASQANVWVIIGVTGDPAMIGTQRAISQTFKK